MVLVQKLYFDYATPTSLIMKLKEELDIFKKENYRDFGVMDLQVCDLENLSRITLNYIIEHKKNWQIGSERAARTTKVCSFATSYWILLTVSHSRLYSS
jgi:hypothetical protein